MLFSKTQDMILNNPANDIRKQRFLSSFPQPNDSKARDREHLLSFYSKNCSVRFRELAKTRNNRKRMFYG